MNEDGKVKIVKSYPERTTHVKAVIGVYPGYHHDNNGDDKFIKTVMDIADEYYKNTGVYVSFIVYPSRAIYKTEWGCPNNGEKVYTIETTPVPDRYVTRRQIQKYVEVAQRIIQDISIELKQETVRIDVTENILSTKHVFKY